MALVAYSDESDYSDNEENPPNSTIEAEKKIVNSNSAYAKKTNSISKQNENNHLSPSNNVSGNFSPKQNDSRTDVILNSEIQLEDDDDVVDDVPTIQTWNIKNKLSTEQVFKRKEPKPKKLKLILPALSEFDDDEEEDDEIDKGATKKKVKPSSSGTGLFAILPKPRSTTSLVPLNVSRKKPPAVPEKRKKTKPAKPISTVSNDSDEELPSNSESNDFFSLTESHSPPFVKSVPEPAMSIKPPTLSVTDDFRAPLPVTTFEPTTINTGEQEPYVGPSAYNPEDDSSSVASNTRQAGLDAQALRRLAGRRNIKEIPDIIDINADDALMSREEWTTRALCDEKPKKSFSQKKEGNPTQQQKRKHQITYLAHQAQEREQELQNSWGQNRFTKMQTQSRYGF